MSAISPQKIVFLDDQHNYMTVKKNSVTLNKQKFQFNAANFKVSGDEANDISLSYRHDEEVLLMFPRTMYNFDDTNPVMLYLAKGFPLNLIEKTNDLSENVDIKGLENSLKYFNGNEDFVDNIDDFFFTTLNSHGYNLQFLKVDEKDLYSNLFDNQDLLAGVDPKMLDFADWSKKVSAGKMDYDLVIDGFCTRLIDTMQRFLTSLMNRQVFSDISNVVNI